MRTQPSILIMLELTDLGDIPQHHGHEELDSQSSLPQQIRHFGWDQVKTMVTNELLTWLTDLATNPRVLTVAKCTAAKVREGEMRTTEVGRARERRPMPRVTKSRRSHDR